MLTWLCVGLSKIHISTPQFLALPLEVINMTPYSSVAYILWECKCIYGWLFHFILFPACSLAYSNSSLFDLLKPTLFIIQCSHEIYIYTPNGGSNELWGQFIRFCYNQLKNLVATSLLSMLQQLIFVTNYIGSQTIEGIWWCWISKVWQKTNIERYWCWEAWSKF